MSRRSKNVLRFPNRDAMERRRYARDSAPRLTIIRKSIVGDDIGRFCRIVEIPEERWLRFEAGEQLLDTEDLLLLFRHLVHVSSDYILLGRTNGANDNQRPARGVSVTP